jgi:hypothetical protein
MSPYRIRFFLDYGPCFWSADDRLPPHPLYPEDLPLSPETRAQLAHFLKQYDQCYTLGCPPSSEWTTEDCRAFNQEMRQILDRVGHELLGQYIICHEQDELIEDADLLEEFKRRGLDFMKERHAEYGLPDGRL